MKLTEKQVSLRLSYVICKLGDNNRAASCGYVEVEEVSIEKVLRMMLWA